MGQDMRLDSSERWQQLIGQRSRSDRRPRLRHVIWAGLVAYFLYFAALLSPIDQILWTVESRLGSAEPSGEIIFVDTARDLADPAAPARRSELANVLRSLDRAGAEAIYIDFVFDEGAGAVHDEALSDAVAQSDGQVGFVSKLVATPGGGSRVLQTLPSIRGKAVEVVNPDYSRMFNITWDMPSSAVADGRRIPTLAGALAGPEGGDGQAIAIDYGFELAQFPVLTFEELNPGLLSDADLSGKKIVIAPGFGAPENTAWIPGQRNIPRSIIAIYAAETARAGQITVIPPGLTFLGMLLLVTLAASIVQHKPRLAIYAVIALLVPGMIVAGAVWGMRFEVAHPALIVLLYAAFRLRAFWQRRVAMRDDETGLPTFRALEEKLAKNRTQGFVVAAKVHGYERVLKLLPASLKSTYLLKIAERLKATEPELELYAGAHYFAWIAQDGDATSLEDHLNGLRALFGAPLDIAGTQVDVGITFGVAGIGAKGERALPAAMAAVEETSEAHEPVRFAVEQTQDENLWDISMRARIDAAMNNGEVYCLYQPKYSLDNGTVTGIEALVRWDDAERGPIPPLEFIRESENAGRMEQLTRYVLQSACTAGRLLHSRGQRISVSVNVSAIMCSDLGIVRLVEEALDASGFPAAYLVLEVTETARIRDLPRAAKILSQLKSLGIKLSIDDFGVGMANYETFYELPFDELKIDRLFIKDIKTDPKARAIASSLVAMGNEARIAITAEGVEDPEDLAILKQIGCTQVQGYAISRPITLSNLLDFLESRRENMV